jgi:acetamidase/formamidase
MAEHFLSKVHVHTRWNRGLAPALEIESGDTVEFECFDSSGGQVTPTSTLDDYAKIDRGRIHTITGPVFVKGARPGDVLEVRIRRVTHQGWGWTSLVPGLGSLPERFPDLFLFIWALEGNISRSLAPVTLPLAPFLGIMGVAPPHEGEHRTRPPGSFGGNLDIRQMVEGTTLYLPIFNEGALFSAGDAHAAQGDGEVCINGIEAPVKAELQLTLHKDLRLDQPFAEFPPAKVPLLPDLGAFAFIASAEQAMDAARNVIHHAIDFLISRFGLSPPQAYILCSVALDLKISQCVNQPMITVTGTLARHLFPNGGKP